MRAWRFGGIGGPKLAKTSWLIVIFGELGLDRPFQALTCEGREETELFLPTYSRGKPAPHANKRHGGRENVVSSSW